MKKISTLLCAASFAVLASGCTSYSRTAPQLVASPEPLTLRLADAVDRASNALETLASVEQARTPSASVSAVPDAPVELKRTVSLDWVGPIEPVTRRLAERAGYEFAVVGDMPPAPLVVTINAVHRSVIDVLRDIGLQAGHRANIVVDAERQVVEVNYAPVTGG